MKIVRAFGLVPKAPRLPELRVALAYLFATVAEVSF